MCNKFYLIASRRGKNQMTNKILRIMRRIQIKFNYLRAKFDVRLQNNIPHIKVNEKHEKWVKWVLRVILLIGIASSLITFSTWYFSLSFSLILFLLEQIFEQIIFTHSIMLVQPLPQNWDESKWTRMIIATNEKDIFLGFGFSDRAVGIDFFNTLFDWNEGQDINDKNIQLSLIQEDNETYSVHVYPTEQRTFVRENYELIERNFDKRKNAGKELNVFLIQISFCQIFPMSPSCAYNYIQRNSHNIYVKIFDTSNIQEGDLSTYENIILMDKRTIMFKNVTVCKRRELDKEQNFLEFYNVPKH